MTFNLSEEVKKIEKTFFDIKREFNNDIYDLLTHDKKSTLNLQKIENIGYFDYYPYLFHNEFNKVNNETFNTIAISGGLYLLHIRLIDDVLDFKELINPSNLLFSNFLLAKSLKLLHSIFNSSSVFWDYFTKYNREFNKAILIERTKHSGILSSYSYADFELIAKGKAAMAKCSTSALAILNNTPEKIEPLEKAQDSFLIASQLYDDLQDWKEDYLNRNYSYLLTTVIQENQLVKEVESNNPPDLETIGRMIYFSKSAENQMDKAILTFKKAANSGINCSLWLDNIHKIALKCQKAKDRFVTIRSKLLLRERIQRVQNTKKTQQFINAQCEELLYHIKHALNYVLTQNELNYPEMQHRMAFPKNDIFTSSNIQQTGVLFQRALVNDTLLEARNFFPNADEIIKKEVETIVADKLDRVRGGWSYFPELHELPPDADSLGQVLQVLTRSKYENIANVVSDPISLLLSDCSYNDGTFETWIVDSKDTSKDTLIIKKAIEKEWKLQNGKDTDVQANILYGLFLYDYKHLKEKIKRGVDTLEKRQSEEGYWVSTWYWGKYYGTYVTSRIINAVKPNSNTLKKTEKFLLNTQNCDGGWGNVGSDPLNTALALLSLVLLNSKNLSSISNGVKYLFATQTQRGYWDKIEFIKMTVVDNTLNFKCKTITTQFCLKALVAISSHTNLEKIMDLNDVNFTKSKIYVYPVYQNLKNINSKKEGKNEKLKLINSTYLTNNNDFIDTISSINKSTVANKIADYKKNEIFNLIYKVEHEDILNICKISIKRCFEKLPMNKMPKIYLWIGDYSFLSESDVINGTPVIIISIEFFSDVQLSKKNNKQTYYETRISEIKNSIPIIIANQYARLALKQIEILKDSFFDKLYEAGFAVYFSKVTFPEHTLSSHLFITEAELEWCRRNEWFLKKEMKPYLQSNNIDVVNNYMSDNPTNNNKWFPDRTGFYVGYRIIEEYLNKEYSNALRDLLSESPVEVIARSHFFKTLD